MPLTPMCLCLLTRDTPDGRRLLLGLKKTGLGTGNLVGLGGHVEPGESALAAAVRETREESGLSVASGDLTEVAWVTHRFPTRPQWDQAVTVFTGSVFTGEPVETTEIAPQWFSADDPPLDGMWDDARYWLPQVLAGHRVRAEFAFAADCATVAERTVRSQ